MFSWKLQFSKTLAGDRIDCKLAQYRRREFATTAALFVKSLAVPGGAEEHWWNRLAMCQVGASGSCFFFV